MNRVLALVVVMLAARTAVADDARAQFRLDGGRPHVGVPFRLDLVVEGFDEGPTPELPKLDIPNATVVAAGAQPNVSRSIQIINGRRSDSTRVSWVLSWKVEVAQGRDPARARDHGHARHQARDRGVRRGRGRDRAGRPTT